MKANVQARLDRRSQIALERLVHRLGWSPSRAVGERPLFCADWTGLPRARRYGRLHRREVQDWLSGQMRPPAGLTT
jgi:hypothetical protein